MFNAVLKFPEAAIPEKRGLQCSNWAPGLGASLLRRGVNSCRVNVSGAETRHFAKNAFSERLQLWGPPVEIRCWHFLGTEDWCLSKVLFACVSDAFFGEAVFGRAFQIFLSCFCIATGFSGSDFGVFLAFFKKAIFGGASQFFFSRLRFAICVGRIRRLA
ncbi:hypothetical protein [Methylomonas fluvii]|uniref:hypothetical protein n=1 Tax=Methylomonas fluvii TaxID=1854564 RepID=UPI0018A72836|nr:hypothetical protein [Methylomonas fluvii]